MPPLGEGLYGLIRAPKRFVSVAGARHNDLGEEIRLRVATACWRPDMGDPRKAETLAASRSA